MSLPSRLKQIVAGAACLFCATGALGQDYPNKTLRIIVANAPGGAPDVVMRVVSPELSKILGQPIVIENKTGAGSIIGYEYVAKQVPPDGYTLAVTTVPTLASLPIAIKNLRFDPLKDLPPIGGMADGKLALFTSAASSWKSFTELLAGAKANPGKLNYGSSTFLIQVLSEAIIRERGVNVMGITYRDTGGLMTSVMGAQVDFAMLSLPSVIAMADKVRLLVVTGEQRLPQYPSVPTFAELGLPQIKSTGFALNAPVGLPRPVFAKLQTSLTAALRETEVVNRLRQLGFEVADQTPGVAAKRLADEGALFAEIGKKANIVPQ